MKGAARLLKARSSRAEVDIKPLSEEGLTDELKAAQERGEVATARDGTVGTAGGDPQMRCDAAAFRTALVASWRHHLVAMQNPELHPSGYDYVETAITFIDGGWAERALEIGWSEAELVGADEIAPWARLDRLGAAYLMGDAMLVSATEITHAVNGGDPLVLRRSIRRNATPPWVETDQPDDLEGIGS